MALMWEAVVVEAQDPRTLGRWWATALGWRVDVDESFGVEVRSSDLTSAGPSLVFVPGLRKVAKNRLHLDFHSSDQYAEVQRLLGLGARRVDVGQGQAPWVVMCDPEGNEFCLLEPRR